MLRCLAVSVALVVIFLNEALSDDVDAKIPTKEEQRNVLKEVEELINKIEMLVIEEEAETDAAVIKDTQTTADRGLDYLAIMKDFALLKLSCSSPSVTCDEITEEIEYISIQGKQSLDYCVNEAAINIYNYTQIITTATDKITNMKKLLLETLNNCSKMSALQQIPCYKNAIILDGLSLKSILLDTMEIHKIAHLESIEIRQEASKCIDETLTICHAELSGILSNARDICS